LKCLFTLSQCAQAISPDIFFITAPGGYFEADFEGPAPQAQNSLAPGRKAWESYEEFHKEQVKMSTSATNISAAQVKELRERSGAPMMDCKNALTETKGDVEQALVWLRKKGIATAAKKAARVTSEGSVASYIHAGGKIGVLVEINCESDFVARTDDFKDLIKDIAMHIAASDPKFVRKEDVTPDAYEKEKEIYRAQAAATGKPANVVEKIVEGKMAKFYEEVCLLDQPFVKEPGITIHQLIASKIGKLGENISVRRFARFKVGDAGETIAISKLQQDQKAE
jgi:elongation factor Ts